MHEPIYGNEGTIFQQKLLLASSIPSYLVIAANLPYLQSLLSDAHDADWKCFNYTATTLEPHGTSTYKLFISLQ